MVFITDTKSYFGENASVSDNNFSTGGQRGRGRPPGSGKKRDNQSSCSDTNSGSLDPSVSKTKHDKGSSKSKKKTKLTSAAESNNNNDTSEQVEEIDETIEIKPRTDVDINSSERLIQRIGELKDRLVTEEDLTAFQNYRRWSKLKDLDKGMKVLISVRDHILQK